MEKIDIRVTVAEESAQSRVTVDIANYEHFPVAVCFEQPLEGSLSQSQISPASNSDNIWSVTDSRLTLTKKVQWASDVTCEYLVEDSSRTAIEKTLSESTVEVRDMDGEQLGLRQGIEPRYSDYAPKSTSIGGRGTEPDTGSDLNQSDGTGDVELENSLGEQDTNVTDKMTPESSTNQTTTTNVDTSGNSPGQSDKRDPDSKEVDLSTKAIDSETSRESPEQTDDRNPDSKTTDAGELTTETTEVAAEESDPGTDSTEPQIGPVSNEKREKPVENAADVESTPALPVTPQTYILQDVSDDIDSSEFRWKQIERSKKEPPEDSDKQDSLLDKLRFWS